jgi:hypothetical protein
VYAVALLATKQQQAELTPPSEQAHHTPAACSFGWWLMAGADLFRDKSTVGWLLVAGLFREKSTADWWLVWSERKVLLAGG